MTAIMLLDLRKQARQLENDIDLKLISFSKFGTSYSNHRDGLRYAFSKNLLVF